MATLNNTNTYTRTMSGLSSVYSDDIEVNTLVVSGTATLPNGYMTLSGNAQTTTSQKTFSQPYQDFTLVNPFMRDFSNNGFAVPSGPSARITMRGIVGAYDTTYSNWRFVSGASATRTNFVQWWYGSGTTLEWTQQTIVGAPPTSNPSAFSGNYALAFTTNAPTQSFYTQMGVNLPAGYYTMTFYSYFGSSPYGGGFIGSTSAFVSISVENSTDTLNYADPETRANSAWKQRIFNFQVVGSNATYIRWTPNEIQSALYTFRWALAGISIRKNNGNFFTDGAGTTIVGGNYSFLENPVLNNPIAQNSLTCQGTPQFSLKTGASNLVLNSSFNTSNNNVNNVAVGWGLLSNSLMTNNTIVGSNSGGRSTSLNDCNIYGYRVSAMNNDTAIGSYIRCNDVSYNFNGWNTVIGSYIGIENSSTRQASTGVAWRCVAIGSEQYTSYNGFGKNPRSPSECISIGYRSQHKSWDNWNVSIGNYSLYNINGNNGEDDGLGYRHYTQYNVALGHEAGTFGNNYSYNTFIGARADASLNDCSFNTAIGYNAKANAFRYCSAFGSGVVNTVADSIRLGRPADTVYIDGSLNVAKDTTLKDTTITGNLSVSGSAIINSGIRVGTTPYGFSEGIVFPQADTNRKLVLYPVNDNGIENYTIGANNTTEEMIFLVPDSAKTFKFDYGTSASTKSNIMTIGPDYTNLNIGGGGTTDQFTIKTGGNTLFTVSDFEKEVRVSNGCNLIVSSDFLFEDPTVGNVMRFSTQDGLLLQQASPFIMRTGTTSDTDYFKIDAVASTIDISGVIQMNFVGDTRLNFYEPNTTTRVGGFYGAHMDLSGGRITLTNQRLSKNNLFINALNTDQNNLTGGNNISGAYTIPIPYSHFYGVQGTSLFTITLPTITLQDLGNEICFRRVSGTSNISFVSSGGQNAYPNGSITGQTTSFVGLTSGTNTFVAFTAMKETGNTTYAWFAHL